jgi:DNA helicase-2/ATP-dependent DNA helicase PcrA
VAELIRQELDGWGSPTSGIAALSFTRIGGAEIRKAIGYELTHPHFVGTIDAFVFRYIIRPFLKRCFPIFSEPRLIPGDWSPNQWRKFTGGLSATTTSGTNIFGCMFVSEHDGKAVVSYAKPFQPLMPLVGPEHDAVKKAKFELWKKSGCLTHSDAALWASKILEHEQFGKAVISEIVRRFPLIVVDEVQDTGYFLGKTIRLLLTTSSARGVVVGDPDQAIYEFNGARPDLFQGFEVLEGAVTLPLSTSLRCPPAVAVAASHVKDSGGQMGPADGDPGRAILVRGNDMVGDVSRIVEAVVVRNRVGTIKVIARQNATIDTLTGRNVKALPKLRCPALSHINRGVVAFRQGKRVAALANVRAGLEYGVFGHEGVSEEALRKSGIVPDDWKRLAVDCLFLANALPNDGTVHDWQSKVGGLLDSKLIEFCQARSLEFKAGKLKPQKADGWAKPFTEYVPTLSGCVSALSTVPVTTVHAVKGETHDVTLFVCPNAREASECLSSVWWSASDDAREERRIAYVAMTRTRGILIVWMGAESYDRLISAQPEFVKCFECLSPDEAIQALKQGDGLE